MEKKSAWIFIAYPESLKKRWVERLTDSHLPWSCSPLHDCDRKEDGTLKKPHYHILVKWPGPTTKKVAQALMESFGGAVCEPCMSLYGSYRYHCHLDNPEKYQYEPTDIRDYNGFKHYLQNDSSYKMASTSDIYGYIRKYNIVSLSVLTAFIADERPELLGSLATHSRFYKDVMQSMVYSEDKKLSSGVQKVGDTWITSNGEVVRLGSESH